MKTLEVIKQNPKILEEKKRTGRKNPRNAFSDRKTKS
jgi:hypothetical protein